MGWVQTLENLCAVKSVVAEGHWGGQVRASNAAPTEEEEDHTQVFL